MIPLGMNLDIVLQGIFIKIGFHPGFCADMAWK